METDLFEAHEEGTIEQSHTTEEPHLRAIASLERILIAGHPCQLQFSSGKDSSACANLLLNAAINIMASGHVCPPIHVCHADTGIENPLVRAMADGELQKMKTFALRHRIPLEVHIARPSLSASYAPRIIGGRALPPMPGGNADCSIEWKVNPSLRINRKVILQTKGEGMAVVTIIGTRSSESAARKFSTAERKETAHQVWHNEKGDLRLSPILDWETDDVWLYLGECAAGLHKTYSDFAAMMEFYADAGASSCVIVADIKSAANAKGCGARGGCFLCTKVQNDRSVQNMIESNPGRYPYLVPLLELRDYISDTQWDWSLRNYIGRTIDDTGHIKVQADQYSPAMVESLLRYMLAAQQRANALGSPSPVKAIGLRELIAIDFYWSLRAWHPPFHALWVFMDHEAGNATFAPKIKQPLRLTPAPKIGSIFVGSGWDEGAHPMRPAGMRDPLWEMHSDSCGPSLRSSPAGNVFLALDESPEFDVDFEGADMFLQFEAAEMIEKHHHHDAKDWTIGASTYLRYGTVSLASGQSSSIDSMMRRSQWLQRNNLHGHRTVDELRSRCSSLLASQSEMFA